MEYDQIDNIRHGGPDYEILMNRGIRAEQLIDFSVCINPYPLPSRVSKAIKRSRIDAYPDSESTILRHVISNYSGYLPEEILVVNGISEAISLISRMMLSRNSKALISGPSYEEYEKNCRLAGASVIEYRSRQENFFKTDTEELCRLIVENKPKLTWICNPNNPTGTFMGKAEMEKTAEICRKTEGFLVVDEAYMNFLPSEKRFTVTGNNIITMRSMTKDFSLPGLRLGYIIADSRIISNLKKLQPTWSVNSAAQNAGTVALSELPRYEKQWRKLRKVKSEFIAELKKADLKIFEGEANFILVSLENSSASSREKNKSAMLNAGFLFRDCSSFGLSDFIRLGVLTPDRNRKLIREIRRLQIWEK